MGRHRLNVTERPPVTAIESHEQYHAYMEELALLMETDPNTDTPEGVRLLALAEVIAAYELVTYPFDEQD